jgi:3-keto-disaccharide hydrolase
MKQISFAAILIVVALVPALSEKTGQPFTGRWDLTITTSKATYPSWLELTEKNGRAEARVVGRTGSVHPASEVKIDGSHLSLTAAEQFGKRTKITWELNEKDGKLTGVQKWPGQPDGQITATRSPALERKAPSAWTKAEPLFNGKDLTGWEADNPSEDHWHARNGELVNDTGGANIRTNRKFDDFKLHIEYNCPQGGNSGVYLRGRYEVQVEYEPADKNDKYHSMGSIYGFIAPAAAVPAKPGQWESYDVTLVGRNVTVVRDGVTVIDSQDIPGITGGALDSHESEPGPIYLQGDHTGGLKYRNITISLPQR